MIDRTRPPCARQCYLLKLARSTASYQPTPVSETALVLMRRIDGLHLAHLFAGARMLRDLLRQEGYRHWTPASGPSSLTLSPAQPEDLATQPCLGGRYQCAMQARLEKDQSRRLVADRQLECCPAREGNRAEGGCKAPPRADGGVS